MKKYDFNSPFSEVIFPCYSVKIIKAKDELQVMRDNKCIQKFKISSFPESVNFSKTESIFELLKILRQDGCAGIMTAYPQIKTTNSSEETTEVA